MCNTVCVVVRRYTGCRGVIVVGGGRLLPGTWGVQGWETRPLLRTLRIDSQISLLVSGGCEGTRSTTRYCLVPTNTYITTLQLLLIILLRRLIVLLLLNVHDTAAISSNIITATTNCYLQK